MSNPIPGYKSINAFAVEHGLNMQTVQNHIIKGYCRWPRQAKYPVTTPGYSSWENMIQRCTNPKASKYNDYGGRGITIHPSFRIFSAFIECIGPRPTDLHEVDRINNDGNYEPGNVRWANRAEQVHNTRHKKQGCVYVSARDGDWYFDFRRNKVRHIKRFKTKQEAVKYQEEYVKSKGNA